MSNRRNRFLIRSFFAVLIPLILCCSASAQSLTAGTLTGTVVDPNNAAVPNATVTLSNAVTGYNRTTTTGTDGAFRFDNVPPNPYELHASATGFATARQTLDVRSSVPISVKVPLTVGTATARGIRRPPTDSPPVPRR